MHNESNNNMGVYVTNQIFSHGRLGMTLATLATPGYATVLQTAPLITSAYVLPLSVYLSNC